jgi:septal ring factor EnvC (AmiA/AmiB activator)
MSIKRSFSIFFIFMTCIAMLVLPAAADEQLEQTKANLDQIKERLDQRADDLASEWEVIQQQKTELDGMAGGATLQGSRANRYSRLNKEYQNRMMKYTEDKEKLRQDVETYNAAVQQMGTAASPAAEPPSAQNQQEIEETAAQLNLKREELAAEYKALQQEKQQISVSTEGSAVVSKRTQEVNRKINEFAKKRQGFNKAVNDFNELTGQSVQTLPEP